MKPNYPFNCWYIAATSDELAPQLLGRRLLGTPVVLYRTGAGEIVAMEDRCLHRPYPLSAGRLEDDHVVCGHDGWTYAPDGRCTDVRSQDNVPPGARVRTFPIFERPPFVWIWLGQPGASTLRTPPDTPWLTDPAWTSTGQRLRVGANYLLLHEHYLDLTNVLAMHPANVPPGLKTLPTLDEVEVSEMSVSYTRDLPPAPLADWEAEATGLPRDGRDYHRQEQGTFVSPGLHVQRWAIDPGRPHPYEQLRIHGFTPETPDSTHVFLHVARNYAIDRTLVDNHLQNFFLDMARRDATVLELMHHHLDQDRLDQDRGPRRDINVKADRAAIRARRVAQAMVAEENGHARIRTLSPIAGD
jgi:vanillate O-demethylase monooxygenase subunit